jgi:hypothetical protein
MFHVFIGMTWTVDSMTCGKFSVKDSIENLTKGYICHSSQTHDLSKFETWMLIIEIKLKQR